LIEVSSLRTPTQTTSKTRDPNGDSRNFRGLTFEQIGKEEILIRDCHFCLELKNCKNPNRKGHHKPIAKESRFYTCARYEYNNAPEKPKEPKKQEPKFNPERLAEYDWILKNIHNKEKAKDAKPN
jgi:hypothetical protein